MLVVGHCQDIAVIKLEAFKIYTFTRDWGFVESWLIDATSLLVPYFGVTDVVNHLF